MRRALTDWCAGIPRRPDVAEIPRQAQSGTHVAAAQAEHYSRLIEPQAARPATSTTVGFPLPQ